MCAQRGCIEEKSLEQFLRVGVITTTHGVKGEVKVFPTTDDPMRFKKLKEVWVENPKGKSCRKVESVKFFKQFVILKLEGIDDINEAEKFRNFYLKISRQDAAPLSENSYYIVDLIGCEVVTEEGENLGIVDDVFPTGSNDVYVVKNELGKQILLPAIADVIKKVDIQNKQITVNLLEGLI